MKIGEILELVKTDKIADIAKREDVHLSEKPLRIALKSAGYEFRNSGQKGWYFIGEGDESSVLEQSIYEYSKAKAEANVSTNKPKKDSANVVTNESVQRSNVPAKEEIKQANEQVAPTKERNAPTKERTNVRTNERTNVVRKRSSFDLDVDLLKELKIQAVMHDKNVYEMVENAIRKYLEELRK
jgi:hypothetical protein